MSQRSGIVFQFDLRVSARRLRPAFDYVPGDSPRCQQIPVIARPLEFMYHRPEREPRVRAATRDDDLRALIQRLGDRGRAHVNIRALHAVAYRSERLARLHIL